ncbi:hypothetical protein F4777DRAFT_581609 [Nemania sp. FL0916]|nr:hypothetical protein F4777DRAFT_581609 [Nemania sp. FL0916]
MQYKTLALAFFAGLVAADQISDLAGQIPKCAGVCLTDGAKQAGCAGTDYKCQCSNIAAITKSSTLCVSQACNSDDLANTLKFTSELCAAVAAQEGGSAASSAIASVTSAVDSAFSSATAGAGSAFSSATDAAGSAISSAISSASSTASSAGSAAPSSTSPAAAHHTAAAGLGMVGAAAMFALAL